MAFRPKMNPDTAGRYLPADEQEAGLIRRICGKDRGALTELHGLYHRRLARFLGRFIRQPETVQEIVNDTLFIVWQQAAQFRGSSRVSTWIMGIGYRRAMKALRHTARRPAAPVAATDLVMDETNPIEAIEQRELMARALDGLPLEQRMVLELTYYMGHSCEEIAAIVDCPVNTVKTRMFHARRKLRNALPGLAGEELE